MKQIKGTCIKFVICLFGGIYLQYQLITKKKITGTFFVLGGHSVIRIRKFHRVERFENMNVYSFAKVNNYFVYIDTDINLQFHNVNVCSW